VYASLCHFFQLPSGSGEGLSYDFDINTFVKNFKLEVFVVNNVLKILEQEELISYSEQFFSPSTVVFTTDRKGLEIFEQSYPQYDEVIKGLLRSYDGIFDYPASINETQLSKFISIKKEKLVIFLNEIKRKGIIDYTPQKEKPQIIFLQNRVNASDLFINEKNLLKRKEAFEKRLNAIIRFIENKSRCRSKMIAVYFNDHQLKRCGICDNCLSDKKITVSKEEFRAISIGIKKVTKQRRVPLSQLFQELPSFKQNKIMKVLTYLQEENKVAVLQDGFISLK
jgi:ATP-dependent DNA helicase RecQ